MEKTARFLSVDEDGPLGVLVLFKNSRLIPAPGFAFTLYHPVLFTYILNNRYINNTHTYTNNFSNLQIQPNSSDFRFVKA